MAAALLARNVLLASRARVGASAARAMSSMSMTNFGAVSQNPAIMMMALNNAPAQSVVVGRCALLIITCMQHEAEE
jgi:hypothetical protein